MFVDHINGKGPNVRFTGNLPYMEIVGRAPCAIDVNPLVRRRTRMGTLRMADELFDRSVTYENLVDDLLELAASVPVSR